MTKRSTIVLASVLAATFAVPAMADGIKDCTKEPQAKWKKPAEAEAAASAAGYKVNRSKVWGSCYEVYAVKDGKNLELFYNPMDLKLMKTVVK